MTNRNRVPDQAKRSGQDDALRAAWSEGHDDQMTRGQHIVQGGGHGVVKRALHTRQRQGDLGEAAHQAGFVASDVGRRVSETRAMRRPSIASTRSSTPSTST